MNNKIKVGFCVAYDWYLLEYAIPQVYNHADVICLSIDKHKRSWAGHLYRWNENGFRQLLNRLDPKGKIQVYEDDFSLPELSPMQNEVRQRNKIAEFMGQGGWHIQLDADEYFLEFSKFVSFLKKCKYKRPINICCPLYTLFKEIDQGYLIIKNKSHKKQDFVAIASNQPYYEFGRSNGYFNVKTNFGIVHQSWARSNDEIKEKINNWGHKEDFDVMAYFERWEMLNEDNYKSFKNFHPLQPHHWESLKLIEAENIPSLIENIKQDLPFTIPKRHLIKSNSIWLSRFRAILHKLKKN